MSLEPQSRQTIASVVSSAHHPASGGIGKPAVVPIQKRESEGDMPGISEMKISSELHEGRSQVSGGEGRPAVKPFQLRPNSTGLPDNLKNGIENLSGFAMDDVNVHYNSSRPAQLQALAFAQGTDIHVAPGQEQHLPHEAWHVVQQKQGRVNGTLQMKSGESVNNDGGLEREADIMGNKALIAGNDHIGSVYVGSAYSPPLMQRRAIDSVIQMVPKSHVSFGPKKMLGGYELPEKVDADPLSSLPGTIVGSKPDAKNEGVLISTLKTLRPGKYVAGHLLNEDFHGPGDHRNLVPLSYATNNLMANTIEQFVRGLLLAGQVVAYQVRVNYSPGTRVNIPDENFVPESLDFRLTPKQEAMSGRWVDRADAPSMVINIKNELPLDTEPEPEAASDLAKKSVKGQQKESLHRFFSPAVSSGFMDESKDEKKDTYASSSDTITEFERKARSQPLTRQENWLNMSWYETWGEKHYGDLTKLKAQISDVPKHEDLKNGIVPLDVAIRILRGQRQELIGNAENVNVDHMVEKFLRVIAARYREGIPDDQILGEIKMIREHILEQRRATAPEGGNGSSIDLDDDNSPGQVVRGMDLAEDRDKAPKPKGKRKQYSFPHQRSFFLPTDKDRVSNGNIHKLKAAIDGGVTEHNARGVYLLMSETERTLSEAAFEAEPGIRSEFDGANPPLYSDEYYNTFTDVWYEISNMVSADPLELVDWNEELKAWIERIASKAGKLF
jgi:hypothetical protein